MAERIAVDAGFVLLRRNVLVAIEVNPAVLRGCVFGGA